MELAARIYDGVFKLLAIIVAFCIVLITALVCADVILRNSGLPTIPWQIEVSEYAQYVITFLGAPWVLRLGGHVRVDVLILALRPAHAFFLELFADIMGLIASIFLFGYGLYTVFLTWRDNQLQIKMLIVPEWWIFSIAALSGLLLSVEFIRRLRHARDRERDSATVQI